MSSRPNSGFVSYFLTGPFPRTTAVRLIIGLYLEVNPHNNSWACFIAASFYDRSNRVLWHKQICLVRTNNPSSRGWSAVPRYNLGSPHSRTPVAREYYTSYHPLRQCTYIIRLLNFTTAKSIAADEGGTINYSISCGRLIAEATGSITSHLS